MYGASCAIVDCCELFRGSILPLLQVRFARRSCKKSADELLPSGALEDVWNIFESTNIAESPRIRQGVSSSEKICSEAAGAEVKSQKDEGIKRSQKSKG